MWDDVISIACAAYSVLPNSLSQESGFVPRFGRDVYNPTLANLLLSKIRYLGDKSSVLSLEMLREADMLVTVNLKRAKDRQPNRVTKEWISFVTQHLNLVI